MFINQPVFVMGHSSSAAHVAMILLNFTSDVDLLLRGKSPTWDDETETLLKNHPIDIIHSEVESIERGDDGWLEAIIFTDGTRRAYRGGFPMYGSHYHTDLATDIGITLNDDGTIPVDDHARTEIEGVFAVGDITPGHNQIPVAMGEGANAGIAIHGDLRRFPRSLAEIESTGPVTATDVPSVSEALQHAAATRHDAS
jgi:thioredoxin reductase (NADPH)